MCHTHNKCHFEMNVEIIDGLCLLLVIFLVIMLLKTKIAFLTHPVALF